MIRSVPFIHALISPGIVAQRVPAPQHRIFRRFQSIAIGAVIPLGVLALWSLAVALHLMRPQILPSPIAVWQAGIDLLRGGDLLAALAVSLQRVVLGLLIGGSLGMGVCLAAMGAAAMRSDTGAWLLAFVLGYIACFALSVGPVTWVVLSEIFPAHYRARAMAIASAALWLANFAVSQTFPMLDQSSTLIRHFGHSSPFFLYACFCALEAWFVWRNLPETKNRSFEEISAWWSTE